MHIKRFTGATVKEAMKAIKAEFGDDALILSTKRVAGGLYEVITAVDYDLSSTASPYSGSDVSGGYNPSVSRPDASGPKRRVREDNNVQVNEVINRELQELKDLKELCPKFMSSGSAPASQLFLRLEEEFLNNGIDKRLAQKILTATFKGTFAERASDENFMRSLIKNRMLENIRVSDPLAKKGIVAFIGPAGAGKTTTIAKLAADHALKRKKRLALLTMDTYRIAAADQLKVYGKIIGVPVEVAKNPGELASHIRSHGDKDLILVDTAGRSQRNSAHMRDLKEIAGVRPGIRFNLVLSAQTRDEGLYDGIRGFCGMVPVDSLTFTKLDEALVHGPIINSMLLAKKPVAYLANGQRVPHDIALATKEKILKLFMPN